MAVFCWFSLYFVFFCFAAGKLSRKVLKMLNKSVWSECKKEYPKLNKDIRRDIVVVGGGIAGFLTAFKLAEEGKSVTLVEAGRLFGGTTGKTTAKITANQGNIYQELYLRYGKEAARQYFRAQSDGMRGFADLIEKYGIDCDFTRADGIIFSRCGGERLKSTCRLLKEFGADCEIVGEVAPVKSVCALKMSGQYLFDPIKFLSALPVNFEIFENTRVTEIDAKNKILYCGNKIYANTVVIATHFPIIDKYGGYIFKLRQSLSYTIAVKEKVTDKMFLDEEQDGLSVRPYANGTLFGGFDHRTGRVKRVGSFARLINKSALYGGKAVTHCWAAADVMTFDGMPYAGAYSKKLHKVYVITGFNKWGMTNAMVCAEIIRDAICGKENEYARMFSPQRKIKACFKSALSNILTNFGNITAAYLPFTVKAVKNIPVGTGAVVRYKGKKRAVYRDENGRLYAIGRMCPHMHGQLKWNADTMTWDCPCHGSRFDIYGNIISEPSVKCCKHKI